MLCRSCLLMYFNPRFTWEENARMYSLEYVANRAQHDEGYKQLADLLDNSPEVVVAKLERNEAIRSAIVAGILARSGRSGTIGSIVDFGGGRGGNIPDLGPGVRRYVLDAVRETAPGVTKIEALEDQAPYDLVMCTHVLEHLPEPASMVDEFRKVLAPDGLIYIEVPYDFYQFIFRRSGLDEHINFFTLTSLLNLLATAGFAPVYLNRQLYPYGDWLTHAICALFARAPGEVAQRRWLSFGRELVQTGVMRQLLRKERY